MRQALKILTGWPSEKARVAKAQYESLMAKLDRLEAKLEAEDKLKSLNGHDTNGHHK